MQFSDEPPSRGDLPAGYKPAKIQDRKIIIDNPMSLHNGVYECRGTSSAGQASDQIKIEGEHNSVYVKYQVCSRW
jgi:hypothetical protein